MKVCLIGLLLYSAPSLHATHNLAGQITLVQNDSLNSNSYFITLTTYTDPAPAGVDRCAADIEIWAVTGNPGSPGNPGTPIYTYITTIESIPRRNGPPQNNPPSDCTLPNPLEGVPVKSTIKRNIYDTTFIFPGPGLYELRYYDVARREGVNNIDKSNEQAFYVETRLFITPPIVGDNNTPVLLNEPLDDACTGKRWTHNPGGFDPDGDSLVYYLRASYQYEPPNIRPAIPATNYRFPDASEFGANISFTMDSVTGLIVWDAPGALGFYNFAYVVEEWRDGVLLGYVIRDMAVEVIQCQNNPPVIETISDTCVYAGDRVQFNYKAWDPDDPDSLYLELNNGVFGDNGPFAVPNAATLSGLVVDPVPGNSFPYSSLPQSTLNNGTPPPDTIKGTVTWDTECDNIRTQFYQVDFYATDNKNYSNPNVIGNTTLTDNKVVTIRVVPPPPEMLSVSKGSRAVTVDWFPSGCPDRVVGYRVYRKIEGAGYMQDTVCCEMSPADAGFELLEFLIGNQQTSYVDSLTDIDGIFGKEICYAITAMYDDPRNPGLPVLESCAAGPECIEIQNDKLYLTNDSVAVTDPVNGSIFVSWSQPSIDSFFPEAYTYRLYRANNNAFPAILIATLPYSDTTYLDTGIDTETRGYNYRVEVFDALGLRINTSNGTQIGSSIYLIASGGNNNVQLDWSEYVPWQNSSYEIFRSDNGDPFVPIASVVGDGLPQHSYLDQGLNPNVRYCYFIRSFGSHNVPNVKPELINDSEVACAFARDEEAPCPPSVLAVGECDAGIHEVTVTKSASDCGNDTDSIRVWFGEGPLGPFREVARLAYPSFDIDTTLIFQFEQGDPELAGCYTAIAVDTLGNVSDPAEISCIDFCPALTMSNVFSPNDDGINDLLVPVFYQDVILKEFIIYDRWGRIMHQTSATLTDLWDGRVNGQSTAREGVYYYYLRYEELGINGNTPKELRGWVALFR